MYDSQDSTPLEVLAESENFAVLVGEDDDGENVYNIEMGAVTLHLFQEEWDELVQIVQQAARNG